MAPSSSTLSPAAPAYVPMAPPPVVPGFATYICMPPPPPPPEFLPWPHPYMAPPPPPPPPCWGVPQLPCVPGMPGPCHGGAVPVPVPHGHGAMMPVLPPWRPAPPSAQPRPPPPKGSMWTRRAAATARPAATAVSRGAKAAVDAKEAGANQPSPRSVLAAAAAPSPPISPTTSLPSSFPYQLVIPAPPASTDGAASTAAPLPSADGSVVVPVRQPPRRRLRGPRRRGRQVQVRRTAKPRRLFDPSFQRTSLMIRNIPNDFTRTRLMNILDEHCFIENEKIAPGGVRSGYDFLYLPIDFRTLSNKGYAFVNMTSPQAARRLWVDLHGHRWAFKSSAKTCAVDYAVREGRGEFVAHFSGSIFDCHTEDFLPVWFEPPRDGARPAESAMHVVGKLARRGAGEDGK